MQGQVTSMFAGAFAAILLSGTSSKVLALLEYIFLAFYYRGLVNSKGIPYGCNHLFYWYALFLFIKYTPIIKEEIHVGFCFLD